MSCCGVVPSLDEMDEVSRLISGKLAAFLRALRDNGFALGLAEGQDAASLMASSYAAKPGLLRSAFKHLFSARKSDWEKFDGFTPTFNHPNLTANGGAQGLPYRHQEDLDALMTPLRLAGLPE